ncbi:MAG: 30S ribosomal protein S18, partial [Elusimicrobiota bacterium]|nr:30S ribosomal protein S18 [Elusimicrobiota bacterium]
MQKLQNNNSFKKNNNGNNKFTNPQNRKFKPFRKKYCKFCSEGVVWIDYKNIDRLEQYVTDKGKIVSAKI